MYRLCTFSLRVNITNPIIPAKIEREWITKYGYELRYVEHYSSGYLKRINIDFKLIIAHLYDKTTYR